MGKSTISMAMFNSYVSLPEGKSMPLLNIHLDAQKNDWRNLSASWWNEH